MPRATGLPLVGALPWMLLKPLQFLQESLVRQGSVFELDLGVTRVVVVADVAAAEYVLLENARNFGKGGAFWDGIRDVLGQGLGTSEGTLWRRQRKLMQPKFQASFLERYRSTIAEAVEDALGGLAAPGPIDVSPWCDHLLETLVLRVLFGSELDRMSIDELRTNMAAMSDAALQGLVIRNLPPWLPIPGRGRLDRARRMFNERAIALITERRRHPGRCGDFLGVLVDATDELGSMSDEQLLDEAMTFYIAGYETTGTSLAWALWLLASQPRVRDELHAEIDSGADGILLRACIQEALRLCPAAVFVVRHAVADDEIGGHPVSAGAPVLVSPYLIQRNPELWPRPDEFDPRRFMDPELVAKRPRLAWIPFGIGQRVCIGKALAMLELEEALRRILRRFTPVVAEDRPSPKPRLSTTLRSSTGIFLHMQPR